MLPRFIKSFGLALTLAAAPFAAHAVTVTNTTDAYTADTIFDENGGAIVIGTSPLILDANSSFNISGTARDGVGMLTGTGFTAEQVFSNNTGVDRVFSSAFALPTRGFLNAFLEVSTDGGMTFSSLTLGDTTFVALAGQDFTLRWGADDVSATTAGFDVFVSSVPLPAGALLLLTGLGGLAISRRRKAA